MTNDSSSAERLQDLEDLEYYRQRCSALQTAVTGARAVLAVADETPVTSPHLAVAEDAHRRLTRAALLVSETLAAGRAEGMFDALRGEALAQSLTEILEVLTGERR